MFPWSYEFGRAVLAVDYMVFTLRLIHIFAIHKQLGPKIIIVEKMLINWRSHTFSKVQEHSDTYWKFQRYNLIVEYHSRPCLAPPFILIKRHIRKIKLFVLEIHGREASRLNTWEAIQKENILFAQNKQERETQRDSNAPPMDSVLKQMAENWVHDHRLRMLETELEYCSSALFWMTEALSKSNLIKPTCPLPLSEI
ncbi:unnamed protein product [Coregonus sp. 'balchen']|nr:unnamed protein product [Coregonus sp. 'balchen']